jgi:C4-dicarboxylate transporter, DctM subunit
LYFPSGHGGLFFGLFTPTEAAAVGVFGVSLRTSCMVMLLIASAVIFGKFLAVTRIPFNIAGTVIMIVFPQFILFLPELMY